jgi:uncharacterized membrane protein
MPLKWEEFSDGAPANTGALSFDGDHPPLRRLTLWPHRSLPRRGFAIFILITYAMFMLPLITVLGTKALWGLLPYTLGALGLTWYFLQRSYRDGALREELTLWEDRVELVRINPRGPRQSWEANPYWVRVSLQPEGGPVEQYLTLRGGDRTVEIGAFLSPGERKTLYSDLLRAFG